MKNIYLSGPMRGIPSSNFKAFDYAARKLREEGFEVFSPADNDRKIMAWSQDFIPTDAEIDAAAAAGKLTARICFGDDTRYICEMADTIAILPGSEKSTGVAAELALAKTLDLNILYLSKKDYAQ